MGFDEIISAVCLLLTAVPVSALAIVSIIAVVEAIKFLKK